MKIVSNVAQIVDNSTFPPTTTTSNKTETQIINPIDMNNETDFYYKNYYKIFPFFTCKKKCNCNICSCFCKCFKFCNFRKNNSQNCSNKCQQTFNTTLASSRICKNICKKN